MENAAVTSDDMWRCGVPRPGTAGVRDRVFDGATQFSAPGWRTGAITIPNYLKVNLFTSVIEFGPNVDKFTALYNVDTAD